MYINDVLRRTEDYLPSEYTDEEKYAWCDEVSAMLAVESRIIYREIRPPIAPDNTALLPEGVRLENISHVYAGRREIPVRSMKEIGRRRIRIDERDLDDIRIVYEQPYYPIRRTYYIGNITIDGDTLKITDCEFVPGDVVKIVIGTNEATANILSVDYAEDNIRGYILTVGENELDELSTGSGTITREVTDKTVCDAPYDGMYIDYVLAKIAEYQKDRSAYNTKMQAFNNKLIQYRSWLASRMPKEKLNLKHWW